MNMSPDQLDALIKALGTQDGSQYAILVFCGVMAMAGMLMVMWFVLNMRLKPVEKLEARIDEMQKMLTSMNAKMWTQETLDIRIDNRLHELLHQHERDCPCRNCK